MKFSIKKVIDFQVKYPKKVIWIFLILNLLLIPGIFKLVDNIEPSLEKVLPQNIEELKTLNLLRDDFGVDMLFVVVKIQNPLSTIEDEKYLNYIDLLSQRIQSVDQIKSVQSLTTSLKEFNKISSFPKENFQIQELLNTNPFVEEYVNPYKTFSLIKVQTTSGSNYKLIDKTITDIKSQIEYLEQFNPGVSVELTGSSAIDKRTFSTILSDFGVITIVSMFIIGIVVFFTFGSLSKGMLPMIIVMNALIWTMGIVGYLNLTLTVVSMVAAAMIMGLGIDFGIHLVHSYYEHKKSNTSKKAIEKSVEELFKAMLGASLTTMAGFLALLFGLLSAMKVLGIILAIGIGTTMIGALFLLPPIIYLYDKNN